MIDPKMFARVGSWDWPEDARESLLGAARNQELDEDDRALATELAGDLVVMDDEVATVLLSILRSEEEPARVRAGAAIAFGPVLELAEMDEFDDPDGVPVTRETFDEIRRTLRVLYADESQPKEVRRRILEASVRGSEDWHRAAVQAAFDDGDPDWRLTAVFCMCYVHGFDEEILEAIGSNDEHVRYQAVCAAGAAALQTAWRPIMGILKTGRDDRPLLLAAIEAAAAIRPDEAGPILGELAGEMGDEEIVDAVDEAMEFAGALRELMLQDEEY